MGLINWGVVQLVRASVLYTGSRKVQVPPPQQFIIFAIWKSKSETTRKSTRSTERAEKPRSTGLTLLNRINRSKGNYGNGHGLDEPTSDRLTKPKLSPNLRTEQTIDLSEDAVGN